MHVDRKGGRSVALRQSLLSLDPLEQACPQPAEFLGNDQIGIAGLPHLFVIFERKRFILVVLRGALSKIICKPSRHVDEAALAFGVKLIHRASVAPAKSPSPPATVRERDGQVRRAFCHEWENKLNRDLSAIAAI